MRKFGAYFVLAAFAFATCTSAASPAFAFWIGPFHFGLPFFGHRHHYHYRHLQMRGHGHELARHRGPRHQKGNEVAAHEKPQEAAHGVPQHEAPPQKGNELARHEASKGEANEVPHAPRAQHEPAWPLLYPIGPLPTMFQNILWGPMSSSLWPIGYETIFSSAFAQTPTEPDQCHQPVDASAIIEQLREEIRPNSDQMARLQRLGRAINTAADRLGKSCPTEIPDEPTARLQLMLSQIEALTTAIDIIRQPLQDFEQSLTQKQKADLAAQAAPAGASESHGGVKTEIRSCAPSSGAVDRSVDQIGKSVQLNDEQRPALDDLHQALSGAANDLEAHCSTSALQSAVARLDALEARLDATWRAVLSIQVALYSFDSKLSADQKNRLKTMTFAAQD